MATQVGRRVRLLGSSRWERSIVLPLLVLILWVIPRATVAGGAQTVEKSTEQDGSLVRGDISEIFVGDEGVRFSRPGSSRLEYLSIERRRDSDRSSRTVTRGRRSRPSREREDFGFDFAAPGLTYERVNGITLWQEVRGSGSRDYLPEIWSRTGYGFERGRWYYELGVLQPVVPGKLLRVGGKLYRLTVCRDFDEEIVGEQENSLAALLFKEDFRDYLEAAGYAAMFESRLGDSHILRGSFRREELDALGVLSSWSLFGRHKSFRRNDIVEPVNAGVLRAVEANYTLDTRNSTDNPTRGLYCRFRAERAGKAGLGGAFEYDRYFGDLRHYAKLGPSLFFDARLAAGYLDADPCLPGGPLYAAGTSAALYPVHKEFYVGGIGTMPGYHHKELRGDRMFLVNTEYRVGGGDVQAVILADAGDAWVDAEREMDLRADVGVGLQSAEGGLRVMVAERLDEPGANPLWWVRLQRSF